MSSLAQQDIVRDHLRGVRHPVIVELGAHMGEERDWIRTLDPLPLHVQVEPDIRNVQVLIDKYRNRNATPVVVAGAVSDRDGMAPFYYCNKTNELWSHGSGSLRPPTPLMKSYDPALVFPYCGFVPTYTLDTIFRTRVQANGGDRIDILWVDVQGSEREVILGGREALHHTSCLMIEVEDAEIYRGEALRPELMHLLSGWTLVKDLGGDLFLRNGGG